MRPVSRISMGLRHTAIVTNEHQLFVAGDNSQGQLGLASTKIQMAQYPTLVTCLAKQHVLDVACGNAHTIVLLTNQEVLGFGLNSKG